MTKRMMMMYCCYHCLPHCYDIDVYGASYLSFLLMMNFSYDLSCAFYLSCLSSLVYALREYRGT